MDLKEKLIELIGQEVVPYFSERIADILIANGVTVQEWIPVSERLPENGQEVFIAYVFPLQRRLTSRYFYSASTYHIDDGNGLVNGPHFENEGFKGMRVTHWMPLPEPPKGD